MYKKGLLKNPEDCAKNCTLFVPISVETVDCKFPLNWFFSIVHVLNLLINYR